METMAGVGGGTTGNDGISSISCIPLRCCANTAYPLRLGRIGEVSLFTHHPPGSRWERAEHSDIWRVVPPWGEERQKSVCSALLHFLSLAYFLLSFAVRSKYMLGFSQMAGPLNITGTVYATLVSDEAPTGVVRQCGWQHTGGPFSAFSAHLFMYPTTWVFLHLALLWSTFSKPVSLPSLYFLHRYENLRSSFGFCGMCKSSLHSQKKSVICIFLGPLKFTTSHISQFHSQLFGFLPQPSYCSNC